VKGTIGVDKPSVTSGSDTYPLDVVAALTDDRKMVTVAIVNPTESIQELDLNFKGPKFRNKLKMYQIAVPELMVRNEPGKDPVIKVEESTINNRSEIIQVAPLSISLYEFELR